MPNIREPREVEGSFVHLLHERRLGIDEPVVTKDAISLVDHLSRCGHVLEDRLNYHSVEGTCGEWEGMPVARDLDLRAEVDVRFEKRNGWVRVKHPGTSANRPSADYEHPDCAIIVRCCITSQVV